MSVAAVIYDTDGSWIPMPLWRYGRHIGER